MRRCLRCGGEIEDTRTARAKYCVSCSNKSGSLSVMGVMREVNQLRNMVIKLQCNLWELEKIIKEETK